MQLSRTIASLALLNANARERGRDFIDNFVPLLATVLHKRAYKSISDVQALGADFAEDIGLVVPYHPMLSIINRARSPKWGLLSRAHHQYAVNEAEVAKWDTSPMAARQLSKMGELVRNICEFASARHKIQLDESEAETALIDFLRHHDLDLVFAAQSRSVLPDVKQSKRNRFIVNNYAQHVCQVDAQALALLEGVALGHMLAAALVYDKTEELGGKLEGVNVYLDTQFILRLLGVEGKPRQDAAKSLVDTMRDHGALLKVFTHTEREMYGILRGCATQIEHLSFNTQRYPPAMMYFLDQGFRMVDVERFIAKVPEAFRTAGMTVGDESMAQALQRHQVDEAKLMTTIVDVYRSRIPDFQEIERRNTVQRDVYSISAIYRLRAGRHAVSLQSAQHVFVSPNISLALASSRFERERDLDGGGFPACVTDIFLGTMIWMLSPVEGANLSMKRLIAECHAALQPDAALQNRLVVEADRLRKEGRITDEQYLMVRGSHAAQELLSEKTLGDVENFTDQTVPEVIAELETKARVAGEQLYRGEVEKHAATMHRLDARNSELAARAERIARRSRMWAGVLSIILAGVVLAGGLTSVVVGFWVPSKGWLRLVLLVVGVLFMAGSILYGVDVHHTRLNARELLVRWLTRLQESV